MIQASRLKEGDILMVCSMNTSFVREDKVRFIKTLMVGRKNRIYCTRLTDNFESFGSIRDFELYSRRSTVKSKIVVPDIFTSASWRLA